MDNNMPLIAGTYKIISQMGSGGGGIVYLAEHLRLGKQVVLKADKRTLSAKPEVLRREVDALKNLNHTYIPQVYDFIEEDGTTYTVMDFIDGESFDKPLKRGERFSQAQVIEWACQLLDALVYLHSRPPHGVLHADIKPSNIMLTPQGDVCLIDFNIALALGEEGAVAVGRSFGYASPEHYGHDFLASNATRGMDTDAATDLSSNTLSDVGTILDHIPQPSSSNGAPGKKTIMLNVRSDIYSLGATLYHMMTGERPIQSATEVKPISHKDFSPAVIAIISKAMNPAQRLRWQSAEEMLYAFTHLRENDPRTKRHKRATAIIAAILTMLFLAGGSTIFAGQRLMEQEQR
ncbi:MAG: serine/threonine protein kinase, partial [Oscillospiraceae bacterium]|nr:serine/threonine protein kinase [Oscillospiraceae bacterium]